jgi:hypothetical protein
MLWSHGILTGTTIPKLYCSRDREEKLNNPLKAKLFTSCLIEW